VSGSLLKKDFFP